MNIAMNGDPTVRGVPEKPSGFRAVTLASLSLVFNASRGVGHGLESGDWTGKGQW